MSGLTPRDLRWAVLSLTTSVMCAANLVAQVLTGSWPYAILGVCFAAISYISWRGIGRA